MSNRILTTISIIIGACGILYGGINAFVKDPGKLPILGSFLGNPGDITLLLLGLLLVIVGVQNLDLLSDMDEGVERIEDIAKQVLSRLAVNPEPIVLEGEAQIYDCAGKLVRNASRYIRAVAFREIHHMDPPLYWVALTEMLAERLRMRSPVEYRLVYGFGRPDDARLAAESHRTFFEARGVHSCLQARFLASSAGVDLLIIDHKHLLLALPVLASDPSVRRAILLSHADDLVGDVVSWFDAYIWANSSRSVS